MKGKPGRKPRVKFEMPFSLQNLDLAKVEAMSLEEIIELEKRAVKDLEEKREAEQKAKDARKIEFFKPIEPYQTKVLEHIQEGKMVVTLQGANGIGKTVIGAVVVGSACLGIQPWDKQDTRWGRAPVRCRILCSDWEKHAATVVVPKLKEWLPLGEYTTRKNNLGIESNFDFKNK